VLVVPELRLLEELLEELELGLNSAVR